MSWKPKLTSFISSDKKIVIIILGGLLIAGIFSFFNSFAISFKSKSSKQPNEEPLNKESFELSFLPERNFPDGMYVIGGKVLDSYHHGFILETKNTQSSHRLCMSWPEP